VLSAIVIGTEILLIFWDSVDRTTWHTQIEQKVIFGEVESGQVARSRRLSLSFASYGKSTNLCVCEKKKQPRSRRERVGVNHRDHNK
jgi:hypothetical protein